MTTNATQAKIPRPPQRTMIAAGIGLPFLAPSLLGPWADALIPAAFGLAFLASLATSTPLLARFARRRAANNPQRAARLTRPDVVRTLRRLNVLWGVTLLAEAALLLFLANRVSASQLGLLSTVLGFGIPALLGAATLGYVRHSASAALAAR